MNFLPTAPAPMNAPAAEHSTIVTGLSAQDGGINIAENPETPPVQAPNVVLTYENLSLMLRNVEMFQGLLIDETGDIYTVTSRIETVITVQEELIQLQEYTDIQEENQQIMTPISGQNLSFWDTIGNSASNNDDIDGMVDPCVFFPETDLSMQQFNFVANFLAEDELIDTLQQDDSVHDDWELE